MENIFEWKITNLAEFIPSLTCHSHQPSLSKILLCAFWRLYRPQREPEPTHQEIYNQSRVGKRKKSRYLIKYSAHTYLIKSSESISELHKHNRTLNLHRSKSVGPTSDPAFFNSFLAEDSLCKSCSVLDGTPPTNLPFSQRTNIFIQIWIKIMIFNPAES